jgi:hypothetical protein
MTPEDNYDNQSYGDALKELSTLGLVDMKENLKDDDKANNSFIDFDRMV